MDGLQDEKHRKGPSSLKRPPLSRHAAAPGERGPVCPTLEEWGLFEAGFIQEDRAREIVKHAADCDACGPLLADMRSVGEASDSVGALRSSTPAWKQGMAAQMAKSSGKSARSGVFSATRAWLAVAASLVLLVGAGIWWWQRINSPEEAYRLLASSYSEHRPFDLRIPGASAAPVTTERGEGSAETVELREAQALIARKLHADPDSGAWLEARARAELLESNYRAAIQDLIHAQDSMPADAGVLGDLGIAYLQSGAAEDLPKALEAFGQAIMARPGDPVLRFNRAMAYHRLHMLKSAVDEWNAFLAIESKGAWADEARTQLAYDQDLLRKQADAARGTRTGVPEDSAEPGDAPVFDALARWSPPTGPATTSPRTKELADLAQTFVTRYRDWWLSDFLDALDRRPDPGDLASLELAEDAGRKGDPSAERLHAAEALRGFEIRGNKPGALRATYELLYSYKRATRPGDCIRAGQALSKEIANNRYFWLASQAWIEEAGCHAMTGDFPSNLRLISRAEQLSLSHGLASQHLRAVSMRAATLASEGSWLDAWSKDLAGLDEFWRGRYAPARAYQFYYTMGTAAEQHGYLYTAVALGEEAAAQIALTGNRTVEAMARMRLANLDIQMKNFSAARGQTATAVQIFSGLADGPEKRLYVADGEIDRARVESEEGKVNEAAQSLNSARLHLRGVANGDAARRFFRATASISERQNDLSRTERAYEALARIAASGLRSLTNEDERLTWVHELDDAYRGLTELHLKRGDTNGALEIWESYRLAHSEPGDNARGIGIDSMEQPGLPFTGQRVASLTRGLSRSVALIYVQMDDGVAAWRLSRAGMIFKWIPESRAALERVAGRFLRDCSDPMSSPESISKQATKLYDVLVAPVLGDDLNEAEAIVLDADGPSSLIPFEALERPDGTRLGDRESVVVTPAVASYHPDPLDLSGVRGPALVVSASVPDLESIHLPPLPDAAREASEVASFFPVHFLLDGAGATKDAVARQLPSVVVFHFAGHALDDADRAGLVLRGPDGIEIWNAASLRNLDLRSCRLAVLSACATGPMQGWGIASPDNLVRAFLTAGVSHVVASRWPVNSEATRRLMTLFYSSLKRGSSVGRALQEARNGVRVAAGTAHPYYWAAFSTFGSL